MAGVQAVWGIDIGRCALKAIKLRPAGDDKVEIVAADYIEHAKILSQPDADRHALIASALEKFLSRNDISKDQVVVSVPGQHTLARFTKLPPVAPKRIPDIVRYEADQQIPFDMDEVIWDYQTFQQEGAPDVEVGIFAMKRELIREHLLHFEQATIEPIAVQSGPLAVYNAANFDGLLSKETTILLDIGAENTDLIVATPFSFWTRTVPIGGNSFTEALVKAFKLSFSKAEALKRTAATSKYARQIFQAMRPIFADLVQELQRSIGFYSSTHRDANVEKVVAFGDAFLLPGLQKYLQQNLGLPVEKPDTFRRSTKSAAVKEGPLKEQFPSFAVAYGLALQGLDLTKVTSNLLPTEIAKQVVWRKKRPTFAAAAACILVAGGLIWWRQGNDSRALAANAEGAERINVNLEQAVQIINSGPSANLSPRARAKTVFEAANAIKKELGQRSGQGETERTATEALIQLQKNKTVVPAVLATIHQSVPREHDPIAKAGTVEAASAAVSGLPPREQRKVIEIEALDILFEPDLRAYPWTSIVNLPPPINDHAPGEPLPGLLVKIFCTTPNAQGPAFVRDALVAPLLANGRQPGKGFYFDNVAILEGARWEPEVETAGRATGTGGRIAGRGSTRSDAGADPSLIDPVTQESRENDWRFQVWADVILDNLPAQAGGDNGAHEETGEPKEQP